MGGMRGRMHRARWLLAAAALAIGCASTQTIPLDCMSEEMVIYVDGRMLEEHGALELRADEPHKLYFKHPGHEPQLIVLEPREGMDGGYVLEPANVCVELRAVGLDRELTVEVEDDADAPR